ncbi:TetR/AcrR family transcriptional regulator [Roseibium sp.]|uniref:TetR/AcrR family transcriptional regulator n=1 Tax=Roseibium sp. TaxID=1936156 RepID=UPI003A9803B6
MASVKTQSKILKTFLKLLETHSYADVSLPMIAESAGIKLSELRENYSSKTSLVAAFAETIDKEVLDERDAEMGDQPARDRLFDILMTRVDHLAPYKAAVQALHDAVRADPALALDFNPIAVRSQKWMLAAAGVEVSGLKGKAIAQGLAVAFARVVDTWLKEDDEGMPRTMARLDKELDQGESWLLRLDKAQGFARSLRRFGKSLASGRGRRRRSRRAEDAYREVMEEDA